jgi:hypothetical protein
MDERGAEPEPVSSMERFSAAFVYVMGAVPALVNLDPYLNLIGTVVSKELADRGNLVVLVGIIGLWFGFQAMERGFVRAHIAQMAVVVFLAGIAGWLAPGPDALGTGIGPTIGAIAVLLAMLALGGVAWAGIPPSLPLLGRMSRRWGRYDRRAKT